MFDNFDWIQAMRTSPVMILIVALSVVTLGFAIERSIYFWKRRGSPERLLALTLERVRSGHLKEASFVVGVSPHPFGAVASEVLRGVHRSAESQEEHLQIVLSEQRMQLERNLAWIGTMGNITPLVGLLGTVWGIMRAFHDMSRTGSAGPSVVAAGVAEALFTTAAGLLIAVPSVMLYNHFVRRTSVMLADAENHGRKLRLALDEAEQRPVAAQPGYAADARPALQRVG